MRRPLRGALFGFGFIAERGHLPGYSSARTSQFEIRAVADVCAPRRELARRLIPDVRVYEDVASLLAAEHRELDFVDICTPPSEHAAIATAALEAGLHVLCEKPLTTTVEDAEQLLSTARRVGRVLFPSHNYRQAPVVRAVRAALDEGAIGRVHLVSFDTFRTTHARGVTEWRPDWRRELRLSGGGIAMDHGSHTFYLAFDWMDAYPVAVSATMSTSEGQSTEDTVTCHLRFPHGAVAANLTWKAGVRRVHYTLHGEHGAILVYDDDLEVVRNVNGKSVSEKRAISSDWMDASHSAWFSSLFDRFGATIEARECVGRDAIDALECVRVIRAAYESARNHGREVTLSPRTSSALHVAV